MLFPVYAKMDDADIYVEFFSKDVCRVVGVRTEEDFKFLVDQFNNMNVNEVFNKGDWFVLIPEEFEIVQDLYEIKNKDSVSTWYYFEI